jgi:hypothetical protein
MKKNLLILLVVVAGMLLIKFFYFDRYPTGSNAADANFRDTSAIILTRHAKCRMNCRDISLQEIKDIMVNGKENPAKSRPGKKGDITYAIDGYSSDDQHIRIILAVEKSKVILITCVDLDRKWNCSCN